MRSSRFPTAVIGDVGPPRQRDAPVAHRVTHLFARVAFVVANFDHKCCIRAVGMNRPSIISASVENGDIALRRAVGFDLNDRLRAKLLASDERRQPIQEEIDNAGIRRLCGTIA